MPTPATSPDPIRDRYIAYVESPEFQPYLKRLAGLPWFRIFFAFVSFLTTVGIPVAIYLVFKVLGHRKAYRRHLVEVARRSVPIRVHPLMVNNQIGSDPQAVAPGLVIGAFDPAIGEDLRRMGGVGVKILLPEDPGAGLSPEDVDFATRLMEDQVYQPHRRVLLPGSLTGGAEVYAFNLMLVGEFLRDGRVSEAPIYCLAEPGPEGEIHHIPWWIHDDAEL